MKLLRTEEILKYDKDLPVSCWDTASEMNIYRGFRCMQCGDIITEECDMVGHKCGNGGDDWEEIEVNEDGISIDDVMVDQEVRILELLEEVRELKRLNSEISEKYEYLREKKTKEKEVE